jgi:SpoVK/Ycf46/Vps4 family AAA+-type ATPase
MVIAATNHEGMLDDALWRRFDEVLHFGRPSAEQLVQLMVMRLQSVRKRGVDLASFANEMVGFSYADAERVCLETTKAMILRGLKEMSRELLAKELDEQRARLALATGSTDQKI